MISTRYQASIISKNNLTLCRANYFETCWCKLNSSEPIICPYLLNHAISFSNKTYFCIYHTIRKAIECFNSSSIFPKSSVSNIYIYLTIILFIIGLIGNGISMIILLCTKLRYLNVYRNLTIFCFLNILYLILILIRHKNNYQQDLRDISTKLCRLHTFTVAFIGHLCSWQLISTSIQRLYALLSLESHRKTSWIQTWRVFFIFIILPLFIFDSQLLFNYGFLKKNRICNKKFNNEIKQFHQALKYPSNISKLLSNNISLRYYTNWIPNQSIQNDKDNICILWNIFDTFVYAIIPFLILLICSFIILIKVKQRRRSTEISGGLCHRNKRSTKQKDYLSTLLITNNMLFLIMTGPLNICLIIQSIFECFFTLSSSSSFMKILINLNEYLRLLQNSYHALSFIFYCIIGNKFRNSAKAIFRTIYYKLIEFGFNNRCTETSLPSCCLYRKYSSSSGQSTSTNSRLSDHRRLTIEQKADSSLPLNLIKRPTYVTFDITQHTVIHSSLHP